jgi:hypothetical protein
MDLSKLIDLWESSALNFREAETLINLLIIDNKRLETAGSMPWEKPELQGWSIVGMNHYFIAGVKHLYCAMTQGGRCITSEGLSENEVFSDLALKAMQSADKTEAQK